MISNSITPSVFISSFPSFPSCVEYHYGHMDFVLFVVLPVVVIIHSDAQTVPNVATKNPFCVSYVFEHFLVFWHKLMPQFHFLGPRQRIRHFSKGQKTWSSFSITPK